MTAPSVLPDTRLSIPGTQSSPAIEGDWSTGLLSLCGDSYPENSYELYNPVIAWLEAFLDSSSQPLTLEVALVYLNTSSVRAMMDIFDLLQEAHHKNRAVAVNWRYDRRNERIAQLAEEFREDFTFPFAILAQESGVPVVIGH